MRNDVLNRRSLMNLSKYRWSVREPYLEEITADVDYLKSKGCIFYLPLNSQDATTDLINGSLMEISSYVGYTSIFDSSKNMWNFKLAENGYNSGRWGARIKTNWTNDMFPNNSMTVIAKVQIIKPTKTKYIQTILISNSISTTTQLSSGGCSDAFCLMPNNGTANTDSWDIGVDNSSVFASVTDSTKRRFYSNGVGINYSASSNYLPNNFLSKYNGYLHFGGRIGSGQNGTEYWISQIMIFNRELSDEEIYEISQSYIINDLFCYRIKSLNITADDVYGNFTQTNVHYSITYEYKFTDNIIKYYTITGTSKSEQFPQNTSTTNTILRKIKFNYNGLVAYTTINHNPFINLDENNYLIVESLEDDLKLLFSGGDIEYIISDKNNNPISEFTTLYSGSLTPSINNGQKLFITGNYTTADSTNGIGTFSISKLCKLSGNCNALLYDKDNLLKNAFYKLFYNCNKIVEASANFLPATNLNLNCYQYMFSGCTSLVTAPELPATKLYDKSYASMFYGCTSLINPPSVLPAESGNSAYEYMFLDCTSLVNAPLIMATSMSAKYMFSGCTSLVTAPNIPCGELRDNWHYQNMFYGCTSLVNVPELNFIAYGDECCVGMFLGCTSLKSINCTLDIKSYNGADSFYKEMFKDCTSLKSVPKLVATNLNNYSYCYNGMFSGCTSLETPPSLPATTLSDYCYDKMFKDCTSLKSIPTLPATTMKYSCYSQMFENCTSLETPPLLPATTLADYCYRKMFYNCNSLVAPASLPATTLADYCYQSMFAKCTSLKSTPSLPATTMKYACYNNMFYGCTSLETSQSLPATTLANNCYNSMFNGCTSLKSTPSLPATTLADSCYANMFCGCTSLISTPNLPSTQRLSDYCYNSMFKNCTSLENVSDLNGETFNYGEYCYGYMFEGCTSLKNPPKIKAITHGSCVGMFKNCINLKTTPSFSNITRFPDYACESMFEGCTSLENVSDISLTYIGILSCGYMFKNCTSITSINKFESTSIGSSNAFELMFYGCKKLNYIKYLINSSQTQTTGKHNNWMYGVSDKGTFIKHFNDTWNTRGDSGIPQNWIVEYYPGECTNLIISANNVNNGRETNTIITYTATVTYNGTTKTINGTATSEEFPQNTSYTDTAQRDISFTYMGVTATTTITQGVWSDQHYTINLNSEWKKSTVANPDSTLYDGVYESYSNKGVNNSGASMYITINGYSNFKFYIRSYAESNYDYIMVSQLDKTLTYSTSYSSSDVKAYTRGSQSSGTALSNYKLVEFTGIDRGEHTIQIIYRKDSSSASGTDCGYVLIPIRQQ